MALASGSVNRQAREFAPATSTIPKPSAGGPCGSGVSTRQTNPGWLEKRPGLVRGPREKEYRFGC